MRKRELAKRTRDLVAKWQGKLLLSDWQFFVAVADKEDMRTGSTGAEIEWLSETMRAQIRVRSEWADTDLDSLEEMVVHELLHCHRSKHAWDGFKKPEQRRLSQLEDEFLDALSRILVEMDRG